MADVSAGVSLAFDVKNSLNSINQLNQRFGGLTSIIKKVGAAAVTFLAFRAAKNSIMGIIDAGAEAEVQLTKLETSLGDTAKAFDVYQEAVRVADVTPFDTTEVVNSVVKLAAVGVDAFSQVKDTGIDVFTTVGNMAGAMGKSVDQSAEAVIDALSGEMERLKEFGITVHSLPPEIKNMTRGSEEFREALLKHIATLPRFQGGMKKMSQTFKGMSSTLAGFASNFVRTISGVGDAASKKAGITTFFDSVKQTLANVLDFLTKNRDAIMNAARAIGQGLRVLWSVIGGILGLFMDMISSVLGGFESIWSGMGEGDDALKTFATKIAAITIFIEILLEDTASLLGPIFNTIGKAFSAALRAVLEFGKGIASTTGSVPGIIGGIIDSFVELGSVIFDNTELMGGFFDVVFGIGSIVGGVFSTILEAIKTVVGWVVEFVKGIIEGISSVDGLKDVWDGIVSSFNKLSKALGVMFKKGSALGTIFRFLGKIIGATLGAAFKIIGFVIKAVIDAITEVVEAIPQIIDIAGDIFSSIGDAIGKVWNWFKKLGSQIGDLFSSVTDAIKSAFKAVIDFFISAWNKVKSLFGSSDIAGAVKEIKKVETQRVLKGKGTKTIDRSSAVTTNSNKTVTHTNSPVININESANPRQTAAYAVNLMNRRFAGGQ